MSNSEVRCEPLADTASVEDEADRETDRAGGEVGFHAVEGRITIDVLERLIEIGDAWGQQRDACGVIDAGAVPGGQERPECGGVESLFGLVPGVGHGVQQGDRGRVDRYGMPGGEVQSCHIAVGEESTPTGLEVIE